ncbi:MAG: protein kinase [Acidobacteria bacterium]|nr:protein kinase [Acidobacteriota bacterium]
MGRSRNAFPDSLATALADGAAIDWRAAEAAADGSHANLVRQLRVVAAMRERTGAALTARQPWLRQVVVASYGVAVALAAIKVLMALVAAPAVLGRLTAPSAAVPFAVNVAIFGVGGLLLLCGGGRDRRLQLLGGLYLTIASAFVGPFLTPTAGQAGGVAGVLAMCRPEAFLALGMWLFAWAFPGEPVGRRARGVARVMIGVACVTAWLLFVATLVGAQHAWPVEHSRALAVLEAFDRQAPRSMYWPVLLATMLAAVPFLLVKARVETAERQRKVSWFLGALAVSLTPILLAAIATPFVPALRDPAVRQRVGLGLYFMLASFVPMTAYAVGVNRVMDVQFVIRATLQYALARYAIWAAILGPLTYLALDVFVNRGLTFLQYLDARQPTGLLALSGFGLVALTFRPHLVGAVDRWFLREPLDSSQALARLEHRFRASEHLRDISVSLAEELARALHADGVRVLLLAEDGASLVAPDGSVPAIPRDSVLLDLLQSTRSEIHLDARSAVARLLPESDQDWLADAGAELLSPLMGSSGALLGVVAIGAGANRLPYTESHVSLVTTMCGHAALQLENRWLRQSQEAADRRPVHRADGVAWQDEPAACCPNCSEAWSPDTRRCRCGGITKPAVLPLFVNAKFRLQRFLGAGGAGVVYLATDLALDRKVAIKTLPPMRREFATRLRREARAMASVRHPNLATIWGTEEWHDTPLLIVEYLEGGTLLDWLERGPLAVDETLDLGIMLADVLDRIHGSGVLHRDIKPSNIGYTADGVPKLLDFGLAAMLDSSKGPEAAAAVMPVDPVELAARFQGVRASSTLTITQQVVGTPLYLSPEALAGSPPQESFDLWSLNMVLYEAIAGRHPFGGRSVTEVVAAVQNTSVPDVRDARPECPAVVAALLNDALSLVPTRRPATASDLRTQLRGLRARLDSAR